MGKKQHSKDRMFITSTEWATEWGGAKRAANTTFKKLPFNCCALTFTPFEEAVCTDEGHVFDILHIVPYIQKMGKNPVTGKPLALKGLHKLTFHKNADGEYQCPVLNKVFTEFTHIVAIKTTGNVFCYDAIKELNIKAKNWKELLTDEPFTRKDIITLQDPHREEARLLTDFDFVKKDIDLADLGIGGGAGDASETLNLKAAGAAVQRALKDLSTDKAEQALRLGGGGGKAQREVAAVLAGLEREKEEKARRAAQAQARREARERGEEGAGAGEGKGQGEGGGGKGAEKGQGKGKGKGEGQGRKGSEGAPAGGAPAMSVVDAASASVAGRSASAAKASDESKTKAKVAAYAAGERVPVAENSKWVQSKYTSGATTRSFTSTTYTPVTRTEFEMVRVEKNPTKKGYCRVHTSHGDLNLELHCDLAPRTCENFLTLAARGYYNGTVFHRNIKNFMIQGGDPTGTGKGGESIWGKAFKDELDSRLTHAERGVVSMANSGPHSNGSQFFVLYKSAPHLNFKHTVFARVVGGLDTLARMEKVPTDDDDRPLEDITITGVTVFVNPYTEEDEEDVKAKEAPKELSFQEQQELERVGSWFSNPTGAPTPTEGRGGGVGKYLRKAPDTPGATPGAGAGVPLSGAKRAAPEAAGALGQGARPAKVGGGSGKGMYGNFDAW